VSRHSNGDDRLFDERHQHRGNERGGAQSNDYLMTLSINSVQRILCRRRAARWNVIVYMVVTPFVHGTEPTTLLLDGSRARPPTDAGQPAPAIATITS